MNGRVFEEIKETADSIDIFSHYGRGVVVRNRAFFSAHKAANSWEWHERFVTRAS